jgi:hypothetical protein
MTIASDGGSLTDLELAARQQLAEDVTCYLRTQIFDGTYRPGDYLPPGSAGGRLWQQRCPGRGARRSWII